MTNKDDFEQKKQDYIMLFGITFLTTFILKTCANYRKLFQQQVKWTF